MKIPIPLYGLVVEEQQRTTKRGSPYWHIILKTEIGNLAANLWNLPSNVDNLPHLGDIVEVSSFEDNLVEHGSITIKGFFKRTKDELPVESQVILEFDKASEQDVNFAKRMIFDPSKWANPHNYRLTLACIEHAGMEKFLTCPAASHVHHSFHGGLLIHTAEVLEFCTLIGFASSRRYHFINQDVLNTAAVLHDIGKTKTYCINQVGVSQKSITERTIGHLFYGMAILQEVSNELNHDPVFVHEVLHCIAAHHGNPEYGSVKPIQSLEAGILSRADYISSRNGIVEKFLTDTMNTGQSLPEAFSVYSDTYFTSFGMQKYLQKGMK